jgi:hypothetical protein
MESESLPWAVNSGLREVTSLFNNEFLCVCIETHFLIQFGGNYGKIS